jgi:hypothetical protein
LLCWASSIRSTSSNGSCASEDTTREDCTRSIGAVSLIEPG